MSNSNITNVMFLYIDFISNKEKLIETKTEQFTIIQSQYTSTKVVDISLKKS